MIRSEEACLEGASIVITLLLSLNSSSPTTYAPLTLLLKLHSPLEQNISSLQVSRARMIWILGDPPEFGIPCIHDR
jgi:hypothetical protein